MIGELIQESNVKISSIFRPVLPAIVAVWTNLRERRYDHHMTWQVSAALDEAFVSCSEILALLWDDLRIPLATPALLETPEDLAAIVGRIENAAKLAHGEYKQRLERVARSVDRAAPFFLVRVER